MTDKTISKGSVNMDSLKQGNTNKDTFTHKKVKNPCGKSLKISNTKQQNNNKINKRIRFICLNSSCKSIREANKYTKKGYEVIGINCLKCGWRMGVLK